MPKGFFTRKWGRGERSNMPYGAATDSNQTLTTVVTLQTQHDLFLSHIGRDINKGNK